MGKTPFITPKERQKRVEIMLKKLGWSYYKLAQEMRTNPETLYRCIKVRDGETGPQNEPATDTLKRLARALGVQAGFFIDR